MLVSNSLKLKKKKKKSLQPWEHMMGEVERGSMYVYHHALLCCWLIDNLKASEKTNKQKGQKAIFWN